GLAGVRIAVVAQRPELLTAKPALAASDGEGDHDAVALAKLAHLRADLDDLAHEFVAEDIPLLHGRNVAVVEMQIGAADGGRRDPQDRIARVENLGVRDPVDLNVSLAFPAHCSHDRSSLVEMTCGCPTDAGGTQYQDSVPPASVPNELRLAQPPRH